MRGITSITKPRRVAWRLWLWWIGWFKRRVRPESWDFISKVRKGSTCEGYPCLSVEDVTALAVSHMGLKVSSRPLAAAVLVVGFVSTAASVPPPLTRGDFRWLDRVTFGIDSATVARYKQLGREKFLDEQLHPPAAIRQTLAAAIAAIPDDAATAAADRIQANRAEQQRINALARTMTKSRRRGRAEPGRQRSRLRNDEAASDARALNRRRSCASR